MYRRLLLVVDPELPTMAVLCHKALRLAEALRSSIILLRIVIKDEAENDKSPAFKNAYTNLLELGRLLVIPRNDLTVVYATTIFDGVQMQVNERNIDLVLLDKHSNASSRYIEKLTCDVMFLDGSDHAAV